jgi:hypothetical protein
LTIDKDNPIFNDQRLKFLSESYTPIKTNDSHISPINSEDILDFWKELQKYNSESTIFWHNEVFGVNCPCPTVVPPPENEAQNPQTDQN